MSTMPKTRRPKEKLPILVTYDGHIAFISRRQNYRDILSSIKRQFATLPPNPVELWTRFEEHGDYICVGQELWAEVLPRLIKVKVVLKEPPLEVVARDVEDNPIVVTCAVIHNGGIISIRARPDRRVHCILDVISQTERICQDSLRLYFNGGRIIPHDTLRSCGIHDGATIDVFVEQTGGKPVIYLFPAAPTSNIRLDLSLVKSWRFSALYPPANISIPSCEALGQTVSWVVNAKPDGTLFDQGTQREVSYLFWEARTNPAPPISLESSRPSTHVERLTEAFDPVRSKVTRDNSVLLPFDKVTGYLDDTLSSLGLHTEARTSFITYWLPELQRHNHIALRFLPQAEYEAAGPMNVVPPPDITTRVFMLFRGVEESQLGLWAEARANATKDPSLWRAIVGVDLEKARDAKLFRVLEWGGMEVK